MTVEVRDVSKDSARRALVVLGMHRSGTSAMTRTLSLLGAALPHSLLAAAEDNPTGFWEPRSAALLNDEILQALDSEWDDVFAFRPRDYLSNFDKFYLGRATELLEQEYNGSEVIALKDPRMSVLTRFWDRALEEAGYSTHYVIMVRNPLEVAESLRAREAFPREKSLLLWSSYMIAADRDTRDRSRIFVSYDQLMDDWRAVRDRIEARTGFPLPRNTAAAAIEIDRFLDRKLRHHQAEPADLSSRSDVPEDIKTLYRVFSDACAGADVDRSAVDAVEAEIKKVDLLVGPLLADFRASTRRLTKELRELENAYAGTRDHADALEEQLRDERHGRQAELEASSQALEDHEQRSRELAEQVAAAEAERDRAAAEAEARAGEAAQMRERLCQAEEERNSLVVETERLRRGQDELQEGFLELAQQLRTAEAEIGEARKALAAKDEDERAARQRLSQVEAETVLVRQEAERAIERARIEFAKELEIAEVAGAKAEVAAKTNQGKLAQCEEKIATLTDLLESSKREVEVATRAAEEARESAEAVASANESKLAQRYEELATLTNLLRLKEQRSDWLEEQVSWLVAINEHSDARSRAWSFLPKRWRKKHALRCLQKAGLFDADAYLRLYPDVAAAGVDPLDHYLKHGLREGRSLLV